MFVIKLLDGEEVQGGDRDKMSINQDTGVLTVTRIDGFEEVTTHFSPSAWASVTHRVKEVGVQEEVGIADHSYASRRAPPRRPATGRGR